MDFCSVASDLQVGYSSTLTIWWNFNFVKQFFEVVFQGVKPILFVTTRTETNLHPYILMVAWLPFYKIPPFLRQLNNQANPLLKNQNQAGRKKLSLAPIFLFLDFTFAFIPI